MAMLLPSALQCVLDAASDQWPITVPLEAIWVANMAHISPWEVTQGLMRGAGVRWCSCMRTQAQLDTAIWHAGKAE